MGAVIVGSGLGMPPNVVTNDDLARIMDTSDEWIRTRSGISERRFVDEGVGASELAAEAAGQAMRDAGVEPADVDLLVTATMTPDHLAPGIAGQVQRNLGLGQIAAFDLRQQCSGFLYALDLASAMIESGRARTAVVVGAEVHAGFQPWSKRSWDVVLGRDPGPIDEADHEENTRYRGWSVLFGDGAGAMVLQAGAPGNGVLASTLHTDGDSFELIWVPGVGFRSRPYVSALDVDTRLHLPVMDGAGLYRKAVRAMPESVRRVVETIGGSLDDVDLVIAHQANDRILDGVRRQLDFDSTRVPSNIARYGNTTSGTLPILFHELRAAGRVGPGALVVFTAFGAGAHYGAIAYREPAS